MQDFFNLYDLTKKEKEIMSLICQGVTTNKDIAAMLCVEPMTVSTHIRSILQKTLVNNKAQILAKLLEFIQVKKCKNCTDKPYLSLKGKLRFLLQSNEEN